MVGDDTLNFTVCWTGDALDPLTGTMPASWIGTRYLEEVRAGRTLGIADFTREPLTADAHFDRIGTRALIGAPILRNGRWHAGFYVNHASVRNWTAEEIELVREVADLTWDAVERAQAEQARRTSEERYRRLFESIDQGFCRVEMLFDDADRPVDYLFLEVNPAFERNTGLVDAVGNSARQLAPNLEDHWFEIYGGVAKTGESRRFEAQAVQLGRWFNVNAFRVGDPEQHQVAILFEDITERRNAQEALHESQERLRTLVRNVRDYAIVGLDPDGVIAEWTEGAERVKGYTADEVVGRHISMFSTPEDVAAGVPERELAKAARNGRSENESWRVRKGGERFWANEIATAIRDEDGRLIGFTKISRDLTERRESELALRASEERFRTLIERSADAVQLVGADGTIRYSSDSVRTVLGYRPDEIAGHSVAPYIHPDDRAMVEAWISEVSTVPDGVGTRQYRVRHRDGHWVWVETTIANHYETPYIQALVGNFRDVTMRRQIEAEREAFVDAAAHDLRSPLTSIKGQAQLLRRRLRRGVPDAATLDAGLAVIDTAAARMVALIDEMMDAAHLRAARPLALQATPTDLVKLARDLVAEVQRSTSRHQVRMDTAVPALVGEWDAARLERVLSNLLGNAVTYSPDGGAVVVTVARVADETGRWAELRVIDHGLGVPEADLPHLFERFRRGGNVAGRIAGAGIGLAGARQIIAQHGGQITVKSREGEGSTFSVRLPLAADSPEDPDSEERPGVSQVRPTPAAGGATRVMSPSRD